MTRNGELGAVVWSLVRAVRTERITLLAASLAYYAFVSLLPLVLLVLAVASVIGGEVLAADVVERMGVVLSPGGQELLFAALTSGAGRESATVLGVVVLLWGALKIFRGLDIAFTEVYGLEFRPSLFEQLRRAVVALAAVAGGVVVLLLAQAAIARARVPVAGVVGTPAVAIALSLAFLPLYVILPGTTVTVREGLPGALFAGGGWTILGTAFRFYAETAGNYRIYGVVGGALLLVTWFYLGGIVLLLGGVLNAVLAGHVGGDPDRQLQQEPLRGGTPRKMTDERDGGSPAPSGDAEPDSAEIDRLRRDLSDLEADIEERTVHRDEIERELRGYVRRRVRRGHATGWGPYLVLLYGTVMTLGAFYYLQGGWAILAMLVIWLSTLGLYALMVVVGLTVTAAGLPGRLRERVREFRR